MLCGVRFGLAAFLVALPLLSACGAGTTGPDDGDCSARIRYDGVVYRPHNALNRNAPRGRELGTGDVVDCGDANSARKVDAVALFSVKGVRRSIAVTVWRGTWRGIYVAEGVSQSVWPRPLRSQ